MPIARFGVGRLTARPATWRTHAAWLSPGALPVSMSLHDFTDARRAFRDCDGGASS